MIADEQNKKQFYKYLISQRYIYSKAKIIRFSRNIINILLAFAAIIIFIWISDFISTIGVIGSLWTLSSFLIGYIEIGYIKKAANIQEIFDTELYNINWNEIQFDKKTIPHELINNIVSKHSDYVLGNDFKNWYEGISDISRPLSIMLCQRQNIVWDYTLRNRYLFFVIALLLINLIVGLVLFLVRGESLLNYFTGLFLPSLSANIVGIEEVINQYTILKGKKHIEFEINWLINDSKNDETKLYNQELREIQNVIFDERLKPTFIPDFFYKLFKNKDSDSAKGAISDILENK